MAKKTIEDQYKALDEIDHILKRPGMYVGSIVNHTGNERIFHEELNEMHMMELTYNPGLCKIFSEILDNCIDEHKRNPTKLNQVKVEIDSESGEISVWDNGGIPVEVHSETNEYVPTMIFSRLRAGSNFNDEEDQSIIGTNGVGSALCNVLSTKFVVQTCDGKKRFKQTFTENMRKNQEPTITKSATNHTKISFIPDYEYFKCDGLSFGDNQKMIKRVYDCSANNPNIKFWLNGKKLSIKSFKDYIKLHNEKFVYEENEHFKVGIAESGNAFEAITFVNSVETYEGGTHVDYIINPIIQKLREFFKKKHKVEVKPADIKQHLQLFISADINRPNFNSQTKALLISEPRDYKTSFTASTKFINALLKSEAIQSILEWVQAKAAAKEAAELRKLSKDNNKANLKKIVKFSDATEKVNRKDCMLMICEGDSAAKSIQSARDPRTIGIIPLKGKPLNVNGVNPKKLLENEEIKNLISIIGLEIGKKVRDINDLRFGKIVSLTDADVDGVHITGLLMNVFREHWPEVITMGFFYMFRTPLIKVWVGKKVHTFWNESEYNEWKSKPENANKKYVSKYFKGLGTSKTEDFIGYLDDIDNHLIQLTVDDEDDSESIDLAFSKGAGMADKRKKWLDIE